MHGVTAVNSCARQYNKFILPFRSFQIPLRENVLYFDIPDVIIKPCSKATGRKNKNTEENKMKTIYNECLGDSRLIYSAFCEEDEVLALPLYGILVKDNLTKREAILKGFTSKKEKAIDFIETLVRNSVRPDFVNDIAEDYLLAQGF